MKVRNSDTGISGRVRLLPYIGAALLAVAGTASHACDGVARRVALAPDRVVTVSMPAHNAKVLIEEIGVDVEYRWQRDAAFLALQTPPNRLGFAVVPQQSGELFLRAAADQGSGQVLVSTCLRDHEAAYLEALAGFYERHIGAGATAARAALPAIGSLTALPADRLHRAWIATARANVLLASGKSADSAAAFLDTRAPWLAAGRPDRAAIATMAAGEEASRAGRYDEARQRLEQAHTELVQLDIGYYAMRSAAALCTILSRQSRYREAIECELPVVQSMHALGERAEATMRHVSIANLWMRLDNYPAARVELDRAQANADAATPVSQARLSTALGNYFVAVGDLPDAAQAFAQASARLGPLGVPADQANVDQKLANLAEFSGARLERLRLLERAAAMLDRTNAPERRASALVQLARAQAGLHDSKSALDTLEAAKAICDALAQAGCLRAIDLGRADALVQQGNMDAARALLASFDATEAGDIRHERALLDAQISLASGDAARALDLLPPDPARVGDPEFGMRAARIKAAALISVGRRAEAVAMLASTLAGQARQVAAWPSAALRVSARNRLADLQAELFGTLSANAGDTIGVPAFTRIADAIDVASVHALFHADLSTTLPEEVRSTLSKAIATDLPADQRALFLALSQSQSAAGAPGDDDAGRAPVAPGEGQSIVLPLASGTEFLLLAWSGNDVRVCRRLPRDDYDRLVARFDAALEGDDREVALLDAAARDWHVALRRCEPGDRRIKEWRVVAAPGTRQLPWSWIAGANPDDEPTVDIVFRMPRTGAAPFRKPDTATLLDLDMPTVAPLPFAARERELLVAAFNGQGLRTTVVSGAAARVDVLLDAMRGAAMLHVVGHANPAAYGQLYQGLWFEAGRKPLLLTYPEIAATPLRAQLVVLSACGTTVTAEAAFGAASKLPEAFVAAGARHVVAASNLLSDAASTLWTRAFYESLWKEGNVPQAARSARSALRSTPYFRHPKFWAGINAYAGESDVR